MISEERIKELIGQESGCYVIDAVGCGVGYIHLKQKYEPSIFENGKDNYIIYIYTNNEKKYKEEIFAEQVFESEEEATEYLKYGNVTRTEKFPYVSWEEFCKGCKEITFKTPNGEMLEIGIWSGKITEDIRITKTQDCSYVYWNCLLSRENYYKTLDKAIRLWKGEE